MTITQPYQICTKTVLDSSYPGITFGPDGECNFVTDFNTPYAAVLRLNGKNQLSHKILAIAEKLAKSNNAQPGVDRAIVYVSNQIRSLHDEGKEKMTPVQNAEKLADSVQWLIEHPHAGLSGIIE